MEHPSSGGRKLTKGPLPCLRGYQPVVSLVDKWESQASLLPPSPPSFLMIQEQKSDLGPLILNIAERG